MIGDFALVVLGAVLGSLATLFVLAGIIVRGIARVGE